MNSFKLKIIFIIIAILYIISVPLVYAADIAVNSSNHFTKSGMVEEQTGVDNINMRIYKFENREMLQLRELAEKLNWVLNYKQNTREIIVKNNNSSFKLSVQNDAIIIVEGRTYISIEKAVELFKGLDQKVGLITALYTDQKEYARGETITAHIRAYNLSSEKIILDFSSGQRFDLYLIKGEKEIWRWSDGRFFTMALARKELKAGERLSYDVEFQPDVEVGQYILGAELATIEEEIKLNQIELSIR